MGIILSCFVLFLLLVVLISLYHLFFWNSLTSDLDSVRVWVSPFECGFLGNLIVENVFSYTYFILLVFFVIFDLEVSLLLNMPYQGILFKNFIFYILFLVLLSIGYLVEVSKGYATWNV